MICIVIKGPTIEEARTQIAQALPDADLIELRLDFFIQLDRKKLKTLREFPIPMIFTLRSSLQGGNYIGSEEQRLATLENLLELQPEYVDIESHVPRSLIAKISSAFPSTQLILSYHNFEETPKDLEAIYQQMRTIPASFYKIAVTAKNSLDALNFICWTQHNRHPQLIALSMGAHGQISRILAPFMGSPFTYAALDDTHLSAPGQLSAKTLIDRYRYRSLNFHTKLYGLIGDPVDGSISDETHNHLMATCGLNALYLKMQVSPTELSPFLALAKQLPFQGLSITMPLKELVLPLLDDIDPEACKIGAVNTLLFENGRGIGFNTDGVGAANAIENTCPIEGKRTLILGAGGASKAIADEICRRGGILTILNRDPSKAMGMAQQLGCRGMGLDGMDICAQEGYDILINCTPAPLPIASEHLLPQAVIMDIVTKPKETPLLAAAAKKGCRIVYGYEMFVEQALGQYGIWFKGDFDRLERKNILEAKAFDCLRI